MRTRNSSRHSSNRIIKFVVLGIILIIAQPAEAFRLPWQKRGSSQKRSQPKQQPAVIDGRVTEEEFAEPLEKAIVQIRGSRVYTVTNRFGYFKMKLPPAFFELETIHPGIYSEFCNVTTYDGIYTPIGAVRLEPVSVGRLQQRAIAARVAPLQHPAFSRNTPVLDMMNQAGSANFNELFTGQPSVYQIENGGGYNSSEIRVRGFASNQNQLVFNGISMNNPETGQMNTPLFTGMNDWGHQVQFTSGVASGKQSELGQTSLINILPFMPDKEFGVNVLASTGANGYLKTAATVHSGLSRNKFAFSLKLDRTGGDGIGDFTGFDSYGVYINLYKEYNHMHHFLLTNTMRTWQADLRTRPDSVSRIASFGVDHNSGWGLMDNRETGWNSSFGIANLTTFTHYWHLRVKSKLVSQLYVELGNSAATTPQGYLEGTEPGQIPSTDRGLIDFDAIAAYNSEMTISENDGVSIRADVVRSTRLGLQSQYIHEFSKESSLFLSFDLEQYAADHFGALANLLGASGFTSVADVNGTGAAVENLLQSAFLPKTNAADKIDHSYRAIIRKGGLAGKIQKTGSQAFAYAEAALYLKSLNREDDFNYLSGSNQANRKQLDQLGWRVAAGLTYRLSEQQSLRLTSGASSSPARFDIVFPAKDNWENTSAQNQNLYSGDLAWVLSSGRFFLSLRGYAMYQQERTDIQRIGLNESEAFAVLSGLNQFHRGAEFSGQMKYFKRYNLYVSASYGKWTFAEGGVAAIYSADNQLVSTADLALKGYNTDNSPPLSLYVKNEFNLLKGLELNVNYYRSFESYAPMLVHDFDNTATPDQLKLPAFDRLGAGLNYYHEFRNRRTLHVFADVQNLLGSKYINQLFTNAYGTAEFGQNQALYGSSTSWRAGFSFSF